MNLIISSVHGRSGSTLLQRIFNSRKLTLIWGEHHKCLRAFQNIFASLKEWTQSEAVADQRSLYFDGNEDPNHWIANLIPQRSFLEQAMIASVRSFFDNFYAEYRESHDLIGFKESQYGYEELQLFRKAYPDCTIILLVRNPVNTWQSISGTHFRAHYQWTIEQYVHDWNKISSAYLKLSREDPKAYLIQYEDLVNKNRETVKTICKLGRLKPADVFRVLDHPIGSSKTRIPEDEVSYIMQSCGDVMKKIDDFAKNGKRRNPFG
ncbi:sulfotransferase [Brevibacillus borstelensis]|uniref:sulfotransferase n=1 Tax=Brevibacillus borstelensis TaxID=45462 RepID=UPI0030C2A702